MTIAAKLHKNVFFHRGYVMFCFLHTMSCRDIPMTHIDIFKNRERCMSIMRKLFVEQLFPFHEDQQHARVWSKSDFFNICSQFMVIIPKAVNLSSSTAVNRLQWCPECMGLRTRALSFWTPYKIWFILGSGWWSAFIMDPIHNLRRSLSLRLPGSL